MLSEDDDKHIGSYQQSTTAKALENSSYGFTVYS